MTNINGNIQLTVYFSLELMQTFNYKHIRILMQFWNVIPQSCFIQIVIKQIIEIALNNLFELSNIHFLHNYDNYKTL